MTVKLVAMAGVPGSAQIVVAGPEFVIGRDPSCQLWLDHACVSGRHCRIAAEGGRVSIEDLGSAYGTIVNGRKVSSAALHDGDRLRIGFDEFRLAIEVTAGRAAPAGRPTPGDREVAQAFADDSAADSEVAETQEEVAIAALMATLPHAASTAFERLAGRRPAATRPDRLLDSPSLPEPAGDCPCLIAEGGKARGKVVKVRELRFLIGRDDGCHLVAKSDLISRVHAAIDQAGGRVYARDLGSTNGTIVNDRQIRDEEVELADGDRLQVGPLRFRVAIPAGLVSPEPARPAPRSRRPRLDLGAEPGPSAGPGTPDNPPVADPARDLRESATAAVEGPSDALPTPAAEGRASLIAIDGPSRGQVFELDRPRFLIGRDDFCDLVTPSDRVNRIHAILGQRDGKVFLRDLGSTHGTIVNDRGFRDEEVQLADGDRLRIGPLHFAVLIPAGLVSPDSAPAGPDDSAARPPAPALSPPPPPANPRDGAGSDPIPMVDALTQEYLQQALAQSGDAPEPIPVVPQDLGPKPRTAEWKVVAKKVDVKKVDVKKVGTRKDGPIFAVRFFQAWDAIPIVNKIAVFLLLVAIPVFAWRGRAMLGMLGRESLATRTSRAVDAAIAGKVDQLKPFAEPKTLPEFMQWSLLVGPALKRQAEAGARPVIQVPLQDARAGLATVQLSPAAAGPNLPSTLILFWSKGPKGDWLLDGHACYLNATSPSDNARD